MVCEDMAWQKALRCPRKCPGKKTAEEIAEIIIKAGVTPKSIIIVWHQSTMDFDLFRELLESAE